MEKRLDGGIRRDSACLDEAKRLRERRLAADPISLHETTEPFDDVGVKGTCGQAGRSPRVVDFGHDLEETGHVFEAKATLRDHPSCLQGMAQDLFGVGLDYTAFERGAGFLDPPLEIGNMGKAELCRGMAHG